jgi:hypothetical protein
MGRIAKVLCFPQSPPPRNNRVRDESQPDHGERRRHDTLPILVSVLFLLGLHGDDCLAPTRSRK